jgi:hypothetical protein
MNGYCGEKRIFDLNIEIVIAIAIASVIVIVIFTTQHRFIKCKSRFAWF